MHPDQPAPVPGLTREQAQRWAAAQPADDARVLVGDSPERAAVVAGLRALAGYLAANPAVPIPPYGWDVLVHAEGTDSEQFSQVNLVSEILGERPVDQRAVYRAPPCRAFLRAGHLQIRRHLGTADGPAPGMGVVRGLGGPGRARGRASSPGRRRVPAGQAAVAPVPAQSRAAARRAAAAAPPGGRRRDDQGCMPSPGRRTWPGAPERAAARCRARLARLPLRAGAGGGGPAVSRAAAPRVPILAGNGAGVWVVLLIGWGLAAAAWLAWLAARLAAALAGGHVPPFSERWVISLARWRTGQAWPGTPTILVALIAVVLACAVITAGIMAWRIIAARIPRPGDPVAALCRQPADHAADAGPGREDRHQAPPVAGRGRSAVAAGRPIPGCCSATSSGPPAAARPCSRPGKTPSPRSWRPARARRPR